MVTVLSDIGRVRSEQEWQNVALWASAAIDKAGEEAYTSPATYIGDWDKLQVIVSVTAAATDAADTLDIDIEMSMDNLAWYSVVGFTQILGNGGAQREIMTFVPGGRPTNPDAYLVGSTDCGATVTREHLRGRYIRFVTAITDANGDAEWTASITAMLFREDSVRQQEDEIKEIVLFPLLARTDALDDPVGLNVWEIGDSWEWMQVVLRITNQDTDAGDHLDTYIDMSVDGVDWYNVGMFQQGDGNLGALVELMTFIPGTLPNNIDAILTITADAGVTVTRPAFVGAFLRARNLVTASGTDDESFTFSLKAYIK